MNAATCNPDSIGRFLADQLDAEEQRAFEQHLDECDTCCAELQQRTASVELWTDTRSFLSSSDDVLQDSVDDADSSGTELDAPRLDFLAPTDDPHMLGRFGGYEISGVIGCGGMGIVLKGYDPALSRYSAIKVLAPHYATSGAARQRFAREAQAAAAVVHDNVIAIHGVDEFNKLPYLIMPYIKGESLQTRIERDGPLSTTEVLRVALQTARGLAAAHDQGLVHRDIKPANILLPANIERVVITDFGLARAADDASLTRSGVIAGTPQYMSPEQARGEPVDARSDLFSLGSVMYAMCTGHPPFRAETPYGILRRITDHQPRAVREINADVPDWLDSIVTRLLSKDPEVRHASADEVSALLEDCLAHVQQPDAVPLPVTLQHAPATHWRRWLIGVSLIGLGIMAAIWPGPPAIEDTSTPPAQSSVKTNTSPTDDQTTLADQAEHWDAEPQLDIAEQTLLQLDREIEFDLKQMENAD